MEPEEYIAILNIDGSLTGRTCLKSEIHQKGYYHNTAHVWYYNANAEILLAQRAASKMIYPLLWDISVAGHVDAGETIAQAAIRETREEIGLEIAEHQLEKIGVYPCFQSYPNGIVDNEFHHTFIAKIERTLEDLTLDLEEVGQVKFVTIPEFLNLLRNTKNNNHFVASNTSYYLDVIKAIEHKIANKKA
ncbi:NUDIX hydrolase [Gelidibacter salicanalis]|uniref:NUDIX domain-containing protein n=1 Tax=Gelidibacter salicanalis TaxID=291193 RepID=A0A934KPH7_9FLAO|nr:NUDIX domain-containing protein [Gelidibacter salicanalis]MBJ7881079.1 NUDIX domain-containing protein [Gelidibacter salicanalis]